MPEPLGTLTAIVSAKIVEKLVENVVNDLYEQGKAPLSEMVLKWRKESKYKDISRNIRSWLKVKTLLNPERAVNISRFYYPVSVSYKARLGDDLGFLADFDSFPYRCTIEGVAGQGKSIYLRHIVATLLSKAKQIPILIELRHYHDYLDLGEQLMSEFRSIGFSWLKLKEQLVELLKSEQFVLLLDAFDEVGVEERGILLSQLETLVRQAPTCRVVVTTRPETEVLSSNQFECLELGQLSSSDLPAALRRIAGPRSRDVQPLTQALTKGGYAHVSELLTTPLMITLLLVKYRVDKYIPQTIIEFYDGLFELLLTRHDRLKAGFRRERSSTLDDISMRQLFSAIAFKSLASPPKNSRIYNLDSLIQEDLMRRGLEQSVTEVRGDIVDITCLIVCDGDDWKFVHKSVQEFYAASYVSDRTEDRARQFYAGVSQYQNVIWAEVLLYLSDLDKYRYAKYFLLPATYRALGGEAILTDYSPTESDIRRSCRMGGIYVNIEVARVHSWSHFSLDEEYLGFYMFILAIRKYPHSTHSVLLSEDVNARAIEMAMEFRSEYEAGSTDVGVRWVDTQPRGGEKWKVEVSYHALLDDKCVGSTLRHSVLQFIKTELVHAAECQRFVQREDLAPVHFSDI